MGDGSGRNWLCNHFDLGDNICIENGENSCDEIGDFIEMLTSVTKRVMETNTLMVIRV